MGQGLAEIMTDDPPSLKHWQNLHAALCKRAIAVQVLLVLQQVQVFAKNWKSVDAIEMVATAIFKMIQPASMGFAKFSNLIGLFLGLRL
jgi:hypothetical protein